jgi:hydrogenase maturation protease
VTPRILIAGIGNIFLGDDGFGVAVAQRLAKRPRPEGVRVGDFGIRGLDLVYALLEEWDAVILVDIVVRGYPPGTLYLIEPEIEPEIETDGPVSLEAHGMDPVKVLALARTMGAPPTRTFLVACEPDCVMSGEPEEDVMVELSVPVRAAVDGAVQMVESLVADICGETRQKEKDDEDGKNNIVARDGDCGAADGQAMA